MKKFSVKLIILITVIGTFVIPSADFLFAEDVVIPLPKTTVVEKEPVIVKPVPITTNKETVKKKVVKPIPVTPKKVVSPQPIKTRVVYRTYYPVIRNLPVVKPQITPKKIIKPKKKKGIEALKTIKGIDFSVPKKSTEAKILDSFFFNIKYFFLGFLLIYLVIMKILFGEKFKSLTLKIRERYRKSNLMKGVN